MQRLSDQLSTAYAGSWVVETRSGSVYEFTATGEVFRWIPEAAAWDLWLTDATWLPIRPEWRVSGVHGPDQLRFETSTVVQMDYAPTYHKAPVA